jgi:hypothetical protein
MRPIQSGDIDEHDLGDEGRDAQLFSAESRAVSDLDNIHLSAGSGRHGTLLVKLTIGLSRPTYLSLFQNRI